MKAAGSTYLSGLKTRCANWREWEMNPIVIKELRQGVRSWAVTGMLLLFLLVLFFASLGFLITSSFDGSVNMELGGNMFSTFVVILASASVFFIPLYTGVRVAAERVENNHDLLYVSTLSPARIILGKFLCSAYIALLFFSACMPFMAFTNLLRGVDLTTVFFILAFLFLMVCAANMVAIFLACLPLSRPFKFLFVIYGLFQSFGLLIPGVALAFEMMRSGVGTMMAGRDFWIATSMVALAGIGVTGLFFVLSVALVSPPSANRALLARIYVTVFWLIDGLVTLGWITQSGEADRILGWAIPTFILMVLALLVTVSNADTLSWRVRRTIPASLWKRLVAFCFFNGAAGGLLWVVGILAATYGVTGFVTSALRSSSLTAEDKTTSLIVATYAFDYALTGLFIQRRFLPRRPPKLAGLLTVLLAGSWAIAPAIVLFFLNKLSWKAFEGLQLGNVFNVFSNREAGQLLYHLYFAGGWLGVAGVLNAKWFARQWQNFRPLESGTGSPAPGEVPPVIT